MFNKLKIPLSVIVVLLVGIAVFLLIRSNTDNENFMGFIKLNKHLISNKTSTQPVRKISTGSKLIRNLFKTKQSDDRIAVMFAYLSSPMPRTLKEKLTSTSWYMADAFNNNFQNCTEESHCFINNFNFANDWIRREAVKYNKTLNLKLDILQGDNEIFDSEIEIPDYNPDTFFFRYPAHFYERLFIRYPQLKNYKKIAVIVYNPGIGGDSNQTMYFEYLDDPAWNWLKPEWGKFAAIEMFTYQLSGNEYAHMQEQNIQSFLVSFVHEYFHTLGAVDKYGREPSDGACVINPATGQEYDSHDLFCHRTPGELGGFWMIDNLTDLIISEPTAREIGWH